MNETLLIDVKYCCVMVNDTLLVASDGQKEKRLVVVTETFRYPTKYGDMMVRLTMDDGSIFYGWDNSLTKKQIVIVK